MNNLLFQVKDESTKNFLKDAISKVTNFLNQNEEKSLIFPGSELNGFHRKLLYNNVSIKFPLIHIHSKSGHSRDIEVLKFNTVAEIEEFKKQKLEKIINEKVV